MDEKTLKKLAKPFIILATLIWGSSFVVMKTTLDDVPIFYLLAFRFLTAAALLSIIFHKRLKQADRHYFFCGGVIGLLLFAAYTAQTYGLLRTTPGNNAFLTASYCVIVPFLNWLSQKKRPDRYNISAALICLAGIGLISLDSTFNMNTGDALTLLGGFFFAAHIVAVKRFSGGRDIFTLTILQFTAAGVLALVSAPLFNSPPSLLPGDAAVSLFYLAVAATAGALLFQNIGQKYTEASSAAVLMTLEAPLGVVYSLIFYGERPTAKIFLGFALIFVAVLCSETKLSFLKKWFKHTANKDG